MDHYDLRSCFLPSLYGLRLRMFQYQQLLKIAAPDLYAHLDGLGVQPTYASQWFLSFFAVNCPLPILLRIYDIIFAEGACETLMRVALALMLKNSAKLLAMTEFDDVMQMLLSRALWDSYGFSADSLIADFDNLSGTVTRDVLSALESQFKDENPIDEAANSKPVTIPEGASPSTENVQTAATRFLGRLWGGPTPQLTLPAPNKMNAQLRKSGSKQSLSSTISSYDSIGTNSTLPTTVSSASSTRHSTRSTKKNKDEDLHGQIEDLLTAMSTLQRENAAKDDELAKLRQAQEDERTHTRRLVELLSGESNDEEDTVSEINKICDILAERLKVSDSLEPKSVIVQATSQVHNDAVRQIAEELQQTREDLIAETARAKELEVRVAEQNADIQRLKMTAAEIKSRWEASIKEKQRLERTITDFRTRKGSYQDLDEPKTPPAFDGPGLREFKLGRSASARSQQSTFNKRSSSLGMQSILASSDPNASTSEQLLMELVNAKTAEATAKQEAEEAKAKLESLRRALKKGSAGSLLPPGSPSVERTSFGSFMNTTNSAPPTAKAPTTSAASVFSSWTGWGK